MNSSAPLLLPLHHRITALLLVSVLPLSSCSPLFAQAPDSVAPLAAVVPKDAFVQDWVPPAPVLSDAAAPEISADTPPSAPISLDLPSGDTLDWDTLSSYKVFSVPLINTNAEPPDSATLHDLTGALRAHQTRGGAGNAESVSALLAYTIAHPLSGFCSSFRLEAAETAWSNGLFIQGLDLLQSAWAEARDFNGESSVRLADEILARYLDRLALLGHKEPLRQLLGEVLERNSSAVVVNAIRRGHDILWFLDNRAERNIFCGFTAANAICVPLGKPPIFPDVHSPAEQEIFIRDGLSAFELRAHSLENQGDLRIVRRATGAPIPVPSIVHWSFGHFSALLENEGGLFRLQDSHLKFDNYVSAATIEAQSSGCFLIPGAGDLPPGCTLIPDDEAKTIFGRHCVHHRDDEGCAPKDGGNGNGCGMARYSFNLLNPGLIITDIPVTHQAAVGPSPSLKISFNNRSNVLPSDIGTSTNLGPGWTFGSLEWLDWGAASSTSQTIRATTLKAVNGNGAYFTYTWDSPSASYGQRFREQPVLTFTPGVGSPATGAKYTLTFRDGSKKIYSQADASPAKRFYLTSVVDPFGNALIYGYTTGPRLSTITSTLATGVTLKTTLGYTPAPGDLYPATTTARQARLRTITVQPTAAGVVGLARVATLRYSATGQLLSITDPVGIVSSFHYASADEIDREFKLQVQRIRPRGGPKGPSTVSERVIA